MDLTQMQMQNNELIKNLSDFYLAKNKLEEFLKMLQRFLQQNSNFLANDIHQFKDFQEFFKNIKIGLDLSIKNSTGVMPEQLKTLFNESEIFKKQWHDRNMPMQEIKIENDKILTMLEKLLANNLYMDKSSEMRFQNIAKENILNLEKMMEKAQNRALDYEKFINNFLDTDDNEGFKNTLRTLIEYKKKADGLNGLEEEIKRIQRENEGKNAGYLANFDIIEKWFKKNNDIFKECENLKLSCEASSGVIVLEKNLK
jgi:DNA-dependent RNA polymerase auxiliary subunit epsilon